MNVAKTVGIPLALTLAAITNFLPEELSFYVFGLRLTATRLLFLAVTPILLVRLGERVGAGRYRLVASDLLVVFAGFWIIYAPANLIGLGPALNHAGPVALEFCIGYMATRLLLSEHGQALVFVNWLCRATAIAGLLAVLDSLTGHFVIHDLASELTGYHRAWQVDYRFGLLRAMGPLEHPILLGLSCAIGLIIALSCAIRSRSLTLIGCGLGAFVALSSAPLQGIFLGISLLIYNRALGEFPFKWLALIAVVTIAATVMFVSGHSPVDFAIHHLIFDPAGGYYRYWTWAMVSAAVERSPWFGLAFGPYPDYLGINHSIDSLWLVLALNFGIPGAVSVALAMIAAVSLPTSGPRINLSPAEKKLGPVLGIAIVVIIFIGFTVDLWGTAWITSGLLTGVKAHLGDLGRRGRSSLARAVPGRPEHGSHAASDQRRFSTR